MQQYTVIFTPRAERQLAKLYTDIADAGGEARAENYIGGIVTSCLSLATFPQRGTIREDIRPHLRLMGYARSATIAFSVDTANFRVAIHGVFYGGQDHERALRETDSDK